MDLVDIGKLAIPGDNPAGGDVRAEDIYEQLATEINKRNTLTADGVVDWALVVKLSQNILQNYSKDILVCSYLCVGLFNTSGIRGFALGLHIYLDLLETYWTNLFPPRIKGRINAIEWWINTVNEKFRKIKNEIWFEEEITKLNQDFDGVIKFFIQYEIEQATDIKIMQSVCRNLIFTETTKPAVVEPQAIPIDQEQQSLDNNMPVELPAYGTKAMIQATEGAFAIEEVKLPDNINPEDIGRALDPVFSALGKISDVLYEKQPLSYILFRINRFRAWLKIDALPLSDKYGKTLLPPPEKYLVSFAQKLYEEKKWMELLKYAEARIVEFRFWLDLSYYVYTALINLNEAASANELAYETLIFTKRLDGVEKLVFSDGMPFANNETLEWISGLGGNEGGSNSDKLIDGDQEWIKVIEEAQHLVHKGDLPLALNKLHYRIQSALSKRDRFLCTLYFCQFVGSIKQAHLAKPYIYELLDSCSKYQLEIWEPTLVSETYQLVLNFVRQKKVKFDDEEVTQILNRLTVIDPVNALKFHNK